MNIIFNKIYIFDVVKEVGYSTEFKEGVNIITSSDIDGTDRGKSVLLRSLYHALGADSLFDSKWKGKDKVYILFFKVNDTDFSIYRAQKLFKLFNENDELIFTTVHRSELANFFSSLFNFSIWLPDKKTNQLVIAPTAYSFLLNFLDQDQYNGTNFNSFKHLSQFSNFKLNVIYSHLGIYNKEYFNLMKDKEELELVIKNKKEEIKDLLTMKERINSFLDGFSCPETNEALENELNIETQKYSSLINEMNIVRNKLVNLRNQLTQQKITISQISKFERKKEKDIKSILKSNICPECHSTLNSTLELRSKKYNHIDNAFTLKDTLKIESAYICDEIKKNEDIYSKLTLTLAKHNEKICKNKKEIRDYIKFMGFNKLIDEINNALIINRKDIEITETDLKSLKKEFTIINNKIQSVNKNYYYLIDKLKIKFNLNELESENYKQLSKNFCASGSNKPLSTVIWYITLNNLKKKFNPEGITFPMVFDSPNNAETDQEKKHALVEYILESSNQFNQLIISAIGFSEKDYVINSKINIKVLNNEKYSLLNSEMYSQNYEILQRMSDA